MSTSLASPRVVRKETPVLGKHRNVKITFLLKKKKVLNPLYFSLLHVLHPHVLTAWKLRSLPSHQYTLNVTELDKVTQTGWLILQSKVVDCTATA